MGKRQTALIWSLSVDPDGQKNPALARVFSVAQVLACLRGVLAAFFPETLQYRHQRRYHQRTSSRCM